MLDGCELVLGEVVKHPLGVDVRDLMLKLSASSAWVFVRLEELEKFAMVSHKVPLWFPVVGGK